MLSDSPALAGSNIPRYGLYHGVICENAETEMETQLLLGLGQKCGLI